MELFCYVPGQKNFFVNGRVFKANASFKRGACHCPPVESKESLVRPLTTKYVRNLTDSYNEWTMCCSVMGL